MPQETLTDVSGDLNPEDAPGIALPGYHPPSPPPVEDRQPVFPQQRLLDHMHPVVSDVLAEDIRRRDDIEKRAEEWYGNPMIPGSQAFCILRINECRQCNKDTLNV